MGTALVLEAPRRLAYVPEEDRPLKPTEVRVRTLFSGISAGTEMASYRGTSPFLTKRFDADRRLFVPAGADAKPPYPVTTWGYEESGEILEVGGEAAAMGLKAGQRCFGTWGHRTTAIVEGAFIKERLLPAGVDPLNGIYSHIGPITLNGILDAGINLGETVAVFGLGVIGQTLAQLARLSGARVIAVDLVPSRRELAKKLGAHEVLDAPGAAEKIKALTNNRGADICIESSGANVALNEAIRAAAFNSKVVALGFYQGEGKGLFLGEEFHHNRIDLVCSQIGNQNPALRHRWDRLRLIHTFMGLIAEGKLDMTSLVTHRKPFTEAGALFQMLDERPSECLQTVLTFEGTK